MINDIIKKFEKTMNCKVLEKTRKREVVATRSALFYYLNKYKGVSLTEIKNIIKNTRSSGVNPTEATVYNGVSNYDIYRKQYPQLDDVIKGLSLKDKGKDVMVSLIVDVLCNKSDQIDKNKISSLFYELSVHLDIKNNEAK